MLFLDSVNDDRLELSIVYLGHARKLRFKNFPYTFYKYFMIFTVVQFAFGI
jgi:hypothetical protein